MKGAAYSLPIKAGAVILSLVTCILCTASIFGTAVFMSMGFYSQQQWDYYTTSICDNRTYYKANQVVFNYYDFYQRYQQEQAGENDSTDALEMAEYTDRAETVVVSNSDEILKSYQLDYSAEYTNFRFILTVEGEKVPISTYEGEEYGRYQEYTFTVVSPTDGQEQQATIQCYVVSPLTANDEYQSDAYWYGMAFNYRYSVLTLAVLSTLMLIVLCVYLIGAAGHKRGNDEIVMGGLHHVPFDLLSAMVITIGSLFILLLGLDWNYDIGLVEEMIRACVGITGIFGLALFYTMSFAVRCKAHFLWKGTLIYRMYHWLKELILKLYRNRSFLWRAFLWIIIIGAVTFMAGSVCIEGDDMVSFFIYVVIACLIAGGVAIGFQTRYRRIRHGIKQMASGDLNARVDTQGLHGEMKEQAENLNQINAAVQKAVEEQLKSERMKTELITNVSHDIKTPLTSIVNYVDLLKKQEVQDETSKEYIEVLERQSIRLKKLIEDLIEASKASTGNIAVDMVQLDIIELLKQVSGEYADRLKQNDLELVLTAPEREIPVLADGQLLWRVFDNLLSNAQKYSQSGTRVYLDLKEEKGHVVITFRNISKYPLNISGEELMERFVRGDSSRHTEGSGLGLSIARSLTELMNGHFEIIVDGDLFKAQITMIKLI